MRPRLLSPTFVLIALATAAYFLSFSVVMPVLPLYISGPLEGGGVAVGVGVGSFSVAAVVLRPFVGRAGDRLGRHVVMLAGAVVATVSLCGFAVSGTLPVLIFFRILQGAGEACFFVGGATAINDVAPPDRRGEAVSYYSLSVHLAMALGPALGETVLGDGRYRTVFLMGAGLAVVSFLVTMRIPDTRVPHLEPGAHGLLHPKAVVPGSALGLGLIGWTGFMAFAPLYARSLGLSGARTIYLVFSGTVLVLRFFGAKLPDRVGAVRVATVSLFGMAIGLTMIGAIRNPVGLFSGTVLCAAGIAFAFPALMSLAVGRAAESERGAVVGTFTMFFDLSSGSGSVLMGAVRDAAGYRAAFLSGGAVAALGPALLFSLYWRTRQTARPSPTGTMVDSNLLSEETLALNARIPAVSESVAD